MYKKLPIFIVLAIVIAIPFLLQKDKHSFIGKDADEILIVITPHNEAVMYEFNKGFERWYKEKTGKTVVIDWRVLAGTQEIIRYVNSSFTNGFKLYWEREMMQRWTDRIVDIFSNPEYDDTSIESLKKIRETFLNSDIGCGIDIFFGGGEVEIREQANKGYLVDSGIMELRPDFFTKNVLPKELGGIELWDPKVRWVGTVFSGFGIIYNKDSLKLIGYEGEPKQWEDLADEIFINELALADPTVSTSTNRAFEMIFQQQMQEFSRALDKQEINNEDEAIVLGWERGLKLIQLIAANARYFTGASTKPVLGVSTGDSAAGLSIDYYGMIQESNLKSRNQSHRFAFITPVGGSASTVDCVGMFRGAPHKELALAFIEYSLSQEGQKLWDFRVGTPGGPERYSLNRPPIRKDLYQEKYLQYFSNPNLNPYKNVGDFYYHAEWTKPVFGSIRLIIKAAFIDPHKELVDAWSAIIQARHEGRLDAADRALQVMQNMEHYNYAEAKGTLQKLLISGDYLKIVQFKNQITNQMRKQYILAKRIANGE